MFVYFLSLALLQVELSLWNLLGALRLNLNFHRWIFSGSTTVKRYWKQYFKICIMNQLVVKLIFHVVFNLKKSYFYTNKNQYTHKKHGRTFLRKSLAMYRETFLSRSLEMFSFSLCNQVCKEEMSRLVSEEFSFFSFSNLLQICRHFTITLQCNFKLHSEYLNRI
jgi:hypothetical protein